MSKYLPLSSLVVICWIVVFQSLLLLPSALCFTTTTNKFQDIVGSKIKIRQQPENKNGLRLKYSSNKCHKQSALYLNQVEKENTNPVDDQNDNDKNKLKESNVNNNFIQVDPGLLVSDIIAIILASQLIGLLDIINDPEFIQAGGWFQPLPTMPTTLNTLVQQIATLCFTWILSTVVTLNIIIKDESTQTKQQQQSIWTKQEWIILTMFTVLRVVIGLVVGLASTSIESTMTTTNVIIIESLRDCYFVGLFTLTLRFLYNKYFLY